MALTKQYEDSLFEDLSHPQEAADYLSACLEEGPEVFLLGVRDVAQAQGGIGKLAEETELARQAIYRMLSEEGNPRLTSITTVLDALGLHLQCVPADDQAK